MEKLQQQYEELKGDLLQKTFLFQKEMRDSVRHILSQSEGNDVTIEELIKDKKKELTSTFRTKNSELTAQYKQAKQTYKQAWGVDEPKYIQDKKHLEMSWIDVDEAIATLSERDQDIMKTYFAWEDIRKLSKKYNVKYQRVRQIRNHLIRKIEQQSKEQIQ